MSLIVRPNSYTAGTFAVASEVNADFNTIYTGFNGNIGQANVTYTVANDGLRVWRAGPNAAGGTNGFRMALFSKAFALGAAASGTQTYTFSTDALYGNPAFSATPTPCGMCVVANDINPSNEIPMVWLSSISSTTAVLQWDRTNTGAGAVNLSVTVYLWCAGDV